MTDLDEKVIRKVGANLFYLLGKFREGYIFKFEKVGYIVNPL